MWLALNDAFVSAVQDRNDPNRLVVRARNVAHLTKLFPTAEVLLSPNADYAARVFVPKEDFSRMLVERVAEIKYDNFKASVSDSRLHRMYERIWAIHRDYQESLSKPDRSAHMAWKGGDVQFHPRRD